MAICNWSRKPQTKPAFAPTSRLIVRLADKMGATSEEAGPVWQRGLRADLGQTRGAQSGEADRHAVWLSAQHLEPKLSPFDPFAIFDEIQRLVPGYNVRA